MCRRRETLEEALYGIITMIFRTQGSYEATCDSITWWIVKNKKRRTNGFNKQVERAV